MSGPFRYIARHWRGELPLWVAFWVNGVLLAAPLELVRRLAWNAAERVLASGSLAALRAMLIGIIAVGILVLTWQLVGVWRAASAQIARGKISGWERSAQLVVLVVVFLAINTYVDAIFAIAPLFSS